MEEVGRVTAALLAVLRVLMRLDVQRHGFAVAKEAGYKPGTVYPVLERLAQAGWVEEEWEDNPSPGRPRRRVYTYTNYGRGRAQALLLERAAEHQPVRRVHAGRTAPASGLS